MGFVPIFITLGAFVFLFSVLVSHNMGLKKKKYLAIVEDLRGRLALTVSAASLESAGLKNLEQIFHQQRQANKLSPDEVTTFLHLFQQAKLSRRNYLVLIQTKPYEFVAKLFGHRPI